MSVTQQGIVYYADDPTQSAFRAVYPTFDDSELDHLDWTTMGVDSNREAVLKKVPVGEAGCAPWATPWSTVADNVRAFAATAPAVLAARGTDLYAATLKAAQDAALTAAIPGSTPDSILAAAQTAALGITP